MPTWKVTIVEYCIWMETKEYGNCTCKQALLLSLQSQLNIAKLAVMLNASTAQLARASYQIRHVRGFTTFISKVDIVLSMNATLAGLDCSVAGHCENEAWVT